MKTWSVSAKRVASWVALLSGLLLVVGYAAYQIQVPKGLSEFAYRPSTPVPLPYSSMRGFTYEQLWGHVARVSLMGPGLLLISWALWCIRPAKPPASFDRWLRFAVMASLGVTALVMLGVLRGRALVDDELVYSMQATFLAEGRLTGPDIGYRPPDAFTVWTRLGYTGKYLPGEALVQIPGLWVGLPALLHWPLLGLTLLAWYRAIDLRAGQRIAQLATIALALSPMVMLTTATGLSFPTSLCWVAVLGLGFEWLRGPRPLAGAVLCALSLTLGVATRPQSMVPIGLVFGSWGVYELVRLRRFIALAVLVALTALGAGLIGAYNAALSGSPWKLPWFLQCVIENYGFGRVWKLDTYTHTPWRAVENLLVVAVRLNSWWLGFPLTLLVFAAWLWLGRKTHRAGVWLAAGVAVLLFQAGYYSPGVSDTGTAYHYELILPGSLIAASVADSLLARWPALAATALSVHLGLGTSSWLVEQTARLQRLVSAIHADADSALARIQPPAILFHEFRPSETRTVGWVLDGFPRRYRGSQDPIVTFSRPPPWLRPRVEAAYPGRSCWYYHRNPQSAAVELYRCEDAKELLDRPIDTRDEGSPLWIRPTAYRKTDFHPGWAHASRKIRDSQGNPVFPCCSVRELTALRVTLIPEVIQNCVEDGP